MPIGPINTADLTAAVTQAETAEASVIVFIQGFAAQTQAAVAAALTADAAANQGSVDAANAAIKGVTDRMIAVASGLSAAITTTPPPAA